MNSEQPLNSTTTDEKSGVYQRFEISAAIARRSHLDFIKFLWSKPDPYLVGHHTKAICTRIDKAIRDYRRGKSTFLAIKVPFRHGKSEIVSRFLPPHFLGEFPDEDVIVAGYGADLVRSFSRSSRGIMRDKGYFCCYPKVQLSAEEQSVDTWGIQNHHGKAIWVGLGGAITGKGGSLIVVDDFFKGREEAESEVIRQKVWEALTNDILTRRAPVTIVIILATPWHTDDPFGRIKERMKEDPLFPRFEEIKFPYKSEEYKSGYLFPERFPAAWYTAEAAILGAYGTASLLNCDPVLRAGNLLRIDKVKKIDECPDDITYTRGWDLASSEKQRISEDPDFTAGIHLGIRWVPTAIPDEYMPVLFVNDMVHGRWEAPERDKTIQASAIGDGVIAIGVEAFGPYKDAYISLKRILKGIRTVKKCNLPGDKVTKASVLEPIFEAGNVYIKKAPWNQLFLDEVAKFPGGAHDDIVDALVVAYDTHNPHVKRVLNNVLTGNSQWKINFAKLSINSSVVVSEWVEKDLTTSCLMGLWNSEVGKLWVFAEAEYLNPQPETVIPHLTRKARVYSEGKIKNLNSFDWMGNKVMFSEAVGDMQTVYRRFNIAVRENFKFDENGSILFVNRLNNRKRMFFDPSLQILPLQATTWCIEKNKPAEGYGMCRALCNMVSFIQESGRTKPEKKPFKEYSEEKQKFQARVDALAGRDRLHELENYDPLDYKDAGSDGWLNP